MNVMVCLRWRYKPTFLAFCLALIHLDTKCQPKFQKFTNPDLETLEKNNAWNDIVMHHVWKQTTGASNLNIWHLQTLIMT